MKTLENYMGIKPFTVEVDESPQLLILAEKARQLRYLPFSKKLAAVKKLTLDAMVNAYEQMVIWQRKVMEETEEVTVIGSGREIEENNYEANSQYQKYKNIVFQEHPLSYALEQKAGCCRYQGVLFFVLGYEADLGDKHFIQSAPVNEGVNTVFNEIMQNRKLHQISIFTKSLKDESLDYSRQNPKIFEQAFEQRPGYNFYSYHRTPSGLVIVSNPDRHVKDLKKEKQ